MICDDCIKRSVCKLYDGSEVKGCIEFYRSHGKVLQEIRDTIRLEEILYPNTDYRKAIDKIAKFIDTK